MYALRFEFMASNNEAEYEALIAGLELAIKMEVHHMHVFSDSLLMTNHVKGTYKAREELMKRYLTKVLCLQESFESFSITQVHHSRNKRAYALSKLASSSLAHLTKKVLVEVIPCRSTEAATINIVTESEVTCMNPIVEYLKDEKLSYRIVVGVHTVFFTSSKFIKLQVLKEPSGVMIYLAKRQ
ncbi:reverse transcriptase domain-containing protein [Tanacetum coccineum]